MMNGMNIKLNHKKVISFLVILFAAIIMFFPAEGKAMSSEAETVLENINKYGRLDEMEIVKVEADAAALKRDFSGTVQALLDEAKNRNDGKLTRIVIPDGEYQPEGRALEIYSNTILDLRGSGADTIDTSDDCDYVTIYQTTRNDDPPSLRCGDQDDGSKGYDFYKNMTVLGGTFVGERADGSSSGNACNLRFGHASNIRIIGTYIKENHGGHHLEIGACKNVLVADCKFSGYYDGSKESNSDGNSLEAIQFDVSHRDNNNFAYYGANDDLPTCDATVTGCTFDNVRRGVGTHHGVFSKPYNNITVKYNTFTNIDDKAIYFVYTKNAQIYGNEIESAVSGILMQTLVPVQQFMPNAGTSETPEKYFYSGSRIYNNDIYLDDTKAVWNSETAQAKYGIRVGGQVVTEESGKTNKIPADTYYMCGVEVEGNIVRVADGRGQLKEIRAGVLLDYAAGCDVTCNDIDLEGYNEGEGESHAGILVSKSPNVNVVENEIRGITNGEKTDGILITSCGGSKDVTVCGNIVYSPKRYGVHCNAVTNTAMSVEGNNVFDAGAAGIKLTNSKMEDVIHNLAVLEGDAYMTEPGISITGSTVNEVSSNEISGTAKSGVMLANDSEAVNMNRNIITTPKEYGILISNNSYAKCVNENEISSPLKYGIFIYNKSEVYQTKANVITAPNDTGVVVSGASKGTYITYNDIQAPAKHGVMVYDKGSSAYSVYGNKISNAKNHGIMIGNAAKATYVNSNNITSPLKYGICIYTKGEAYQVKSNTITNSKDTAIAVSGASKGSYITYNTIKTPGKYGVMVYDKGSSAYSVYGNKISNAKNHGIMIGNAAKATYVSSNTITAPAKNGIMIYKNSTINQAKANTISKAKSTGLAVSDGSEAKYITSNTITSPAKHGIMIYNDSYSESITSNKVSSAAGNGILVDDDAKVSPKSKAFLIQSNTLTKCKKRSISNNAWVNAMVSNKATGCAYSNKPYIKKGLSLNKYQVSVKKGKTATITYTKASATKGKVTWSTSNKKIVKVNKNGKITGVKKGVAYVYAKAGGVQVKAKVTVK